MKNLTMGTNNGVLAHPRHYPTVISWLLATAGGREAGVGSLGHHLPQSNEPKKKRKS